MENVFAWPERIEGAVSLTYDDGLPIHYTVVDPLLRECSLRATFYPMIQSDLQLHPERWRELAAVGHELGNHTVFHPCRQSLTNPDPRLGELYDLSRYTTEQLRAELEVANLVLHLLDGQSERTFGNTCCNTTLGSAAMEQSFEPLLAESFLAARGSLTNRIARPAQDINLFNIGCIDAAGRSLEDLKDLIEQTRACSGWAILMIHGVGADTHHLYLETDVHEHFIHWLAQQQAIWTAPVRVLARYIKEHIRPAGQPE